MLSVPPIPWSMMGPTPQIEHLPRGLEDVRNAWAAAEDDRIDAHEEWIRAWHSALSQRERTGDGLLWDDERLGFTWYFPLVMLDRETARSCARDFGHRGAIDDVRVGYFMQGASLETVMCAVSYGFACMARASADVGVAPSSMEKHEGFFRAYAAFSYARSVVESDEEDMFAGARDIWAFVAPDSLRTLESLAFVCGHTEFIVASRCDTDASLAESRRAFSEMIRILEGVPAKESHFTAQSVAVLTALTHANACFAAYAHEELLGDYHRAHAFCRRCDETLTRLRDELGVDVPAGPLGVVSVALERIDMILKRVVSAGDHQSPASTNVLWGGDRPGAYLPMGTRREGSRAPLPEPRFEYPVALQ